MKVAIYQAPPTDGDCEAALARLGAQLRAAAMAGARMLVAPELYLPGYNRPDLHAGRAPVDGPRWKHRLAALAREEGCGLTVGWAEAAEGRLWNAATAFGPDGAELAHYRKIQLFGEMERAGFAPGDGYAVFAFEGWQVGLLICYDIEFPEHARALADRGARLILVPTANPEGYAHVHEVLVPARAAESGLTILYANYAGNEAGLAFGGGSVIVGPDARPLATAGRGEALLVADLAALDGVAPALTSTQLQDRRSAS